MGIPRTSLEKKVCECGLVSVFKEVTKDGPTKGKWFRTCVKASQKCKFFEWCDENDRLPPSNSTRSNSSIKCFKCGEVRRFSKVFFIL
jgi:hypothetical protein